MTLKLPTNEKLTQALLSALKNLGGEAMVPELDKEVISILEIPAEVAQIIRSGNRTELQYRLAWVRTKAKKNGLITNPSSKKWKLVS